MSKKDDIKTISGIYEDEVSDVLRKTNTSDTFLGEQE